MKWGKANFKIKNIIKRISLDNLVIIMSLLFVIFPIIIFLWGWTKLWISSICTVGLIFIVVNIYSEIKDEFTISVKNNISFWVISISIITLWCLFSGIGKFSYQSGDFKARNAFFQDLCNMDWPIVLDMSKQPIDIQNLFIDVKSANLVYYFTWWLPVALIVKIFNLSPLAGNTLLVLYAIIEVFLIYYCFLNIIKKYSYIALSSLILFGGWDFWVYFIENFNFIKMGHVEWWATYFQYSSNTTQMYWVFNSSLPIWLITCLVMIMPKNRYKAAVGSLAFAYNPFATVSMVFIVLTDILGKRTEKILDKLKELCSIPNILTSLLMLVIWGCFYLQVNINGTSTDGLIFNIYPEQKLFVTYVLFLMVEIGVYFFAIGCSIDKDRFYWVTLIGLILMPMIKIGRYNDWSLKAPVPLLFILMIMVVKRYHVESTMKKKYAILAVLFLGYMTSAVELQRNISGTLTMSQSDYTWHVVDSFEYIYTGEEGTDRMLAMQYLAPRENKSWNRYIFK